MQHLLILEGLRKRQCPDDEPEALSNSMGPPSSLIYQTELKASEANVEACPPPPYTPRPLPTKLRL